MSKLSLGINVVKIIGIKIYGQLRKIIDLSLQMY